MATSFRTAIDSAAGDLSLEQLTEVVKNVSKLAPHTAPQQLRREAERRGHREALRATDRRYMQELPLALFQCPLLSGALS
jgi:hypothetical protein